VNTWTAVLATVRVVMPAAVTVEVLEEMWLAAVRFALLSRSAKVFAVEAVAWVGRIDQSAAAVGALIRATKVAIRPALTVMSAPAAED
jgi:hypothetical protein